MPVPAGTMAQSQSLPRKRQGRGGAAACSGVGSAGDHRKYPMGYLIWGDQGEPKPALTPLADLKPTSSMLT